jgi:hypothetical protein
MADQNKPDHGPIEDKHRALMNAVAHQLDKAFKPHGFMLLVFDKNSTDGRMNYICNCDRDDMVKAMQEFINNHEASKK